MNDPVKAEQQQLQRIVPQSDEPIESYRDDAHGIDVRIDPAHAPPLETVIHDVEWQNLEHFVTERTPKPMPVNPATAYADANRLINRRYETTPGILPDGLEQREQSYRLRLRSLQEEEQRLNQRLEYEQAQLDARKTQQQKNESSLAERMIAFELQARKFDTDRQSIGELRSGLQTQRAELDRQRAELEHRKKSLRDEVLSELQGHRKEIELTKSGLQKDVEHAKVLKETLDERLNALAARNDQLLKGERGKLWQALAEEYEERKREFEHEKAIWAQSREQQQSELEYLREMQRRELDREQQQWVQSCAQQRAEIDRDRAEVLAELAVQRDQFQHERAIIAAELSQEKARAQQEIDLERESWHQIRQQEKQRLDHERALLVDELSQEKTHALQEIELEREAWNQIRLQEKQDLDRERLIFESAIETANAEFLRARDELEQELREQRDRHGIELSTRTDALEAELSQARGNASLEMDILRTQLLERFDQQQQELEQQHAQERSELRAAHESREAEFESQRVEWEHERQRQWEQLQAQRRELELLREQHAALLEGQQAEWEESRETEIEALAGQRLELTNAREAIEQELAVVREQHETALAADRAQLVEQQNEFLRERTLIENRIRFQQDHLDKKRHELEQAQQQFRRERQIEIQRMEEAGVLLLRRLKQVDLYRSSIEAREKSLDREQETIARTRQAITSTAEFDRMNFAAEKHAWEQEHKNQLGDLRRQQEELVERAESLESRRIRLDKLRNELEETHRTTLEMRLAVEESWAQLTQAAGQDDARQRVEQVRQTLVGYYEQMHRSLAEQSQTQLEAQSKFDRQRAEFADERQKLTAWLSQRDEELRLGEERLRIAAGEAATNHSKWLAARDQWLLEKTEAEQLIRRLLASLGDTNREQTNVADSFIRLNQMASLT